MSAALGTLAFAGFLSAMTAGRWFGPGLLDRYGRVRVVRTIALIGIVGVVVFVFSPVPALAYAGALLWGLGASLGFPVGMSAGGDDPRRAAARVSVIASIGYCAFLAGPPAIGFLGHHVTVLRALTAVMVTLAIATLITPVIRPLRPNRSFGEAGEVWRPREVQPNAPPGSEPSRDRLRSMAEERTSRAPDGKAPRRPPKRNLRPTRSHTRST